MNRFKLLKIIKINPKTKLSKNQIENFKLKNFDLKPMKRNWHKKRKSYKNFTILHQDFEI